ncbi:NAD(+) synthase [Carboxylicivirga mesophila]|uniref:NH(3)-dependent NAD(+) synthetase n=1 Tax=Carboxylicivirga mesophila TaxID=1166478 RepID=A0ABS5K980_9BACT|nr:NAD(+) synthase [Carboxylicivirga mesophila]MBS2211510.1 NAD(+) synthase [Carboxylicivirga mesophila]
MSEQKFTKEIIRLSDTQNTIDSIVAKLKEDVIKVLRRRGGVVGISGGIDSSVTLALAVKAFGAKNVLGVMLPEKDSSDDSKALALKLADKFGVRVVEENISGALEGFGCYQRRDEAVKRVIPEYNPQTDKMKIGIPVEFLNSNMPPVFYVTVIFADGTEKSERLPMNEYLQIVAASNFKQRSRMSMLYYHAEALHYAVIGTPNKHEVQQGFFVKYGDGGADVMPIGNLFKTQVYELARELGVPQEIIDRTPTTDTYTAEQTQEEFFYQMPFETMDLLWYGWENGFSPEEVAMGMEKDEQEISRIFKNFERKKKTTDYLRMPPIHNY